MTNLYEGSTHNGLEDSVIADDTLVESRLNQLSGLTKDVLLQALDQGVRQRLNCSPLLPITFPGQAQWAYTIEALRLQVCTSGWKHESHHNLPVTISPNEDFGVVVYTGDEDTGRASGFPSNKTSKGIKTQQAVLRNSLNLELFPETLQNKEESEENTLKTWVLLYHLDISNQQRPVLRSELSFPSHFDIGLGKILAWKQRIILGEIDLSGDPDIINAYNDDIDVPLEVPVRRKAS
ncbi:hypothetical protein [Chromobacterium sp. ASV23]|uniref:hypothetical protein n=1 Tax=Chromobacterium sp. ASV23 TaxID=2795110 RepID=UPI0018ECBD8E|nr:hypothetical protein [Chromobacterium sp. ASV23]